MQARLLECLSLLIGVDDFGGHELVEGLIWVFGDQAVHAGGCILTRMGIWMVLGLIQVTYQLFSDIAYPPLKLNVSYIWSRGIVTTNSLLQLFDMRRL